MKTVYLLALLLLTTILSAQTSLQTPNQSLEEIEMQLKVILPKQHSQTNFQGNPVKQLDSSLLLFIGNDPLFSDGDFKYTFEYDAAYNSTGEQWYKRQDSSAAWGLTNDFIRAFDINNNLIEETHYYDWSTVYNTFIQGVKFEFDINNNLVTERVESSFSGPSQIWEFQSKTLISYNTIGQVTEEISYVWNNNQWELSSKSVNTYNNIDLLVLNESFTYSNMTWDPTYKLDYIYNSNDTVIQALQLRYTGGTWVNYNKFDITYLPNGGEIYETSTWDGVAWENYYKFDFLRDPFYNLTTRTVYNWNPAIQGWSATIQDTYTNDNNFPYAVLATTLSENECRHQLLKKDVKEAILMAGALELVYAHTYYWSDLISTSNKPTTIHSQEISVYPNPTTSELYFELPNTDLQTTVELYNAAGQRLLITTLKNNRIQLPDLPTGFYSYQVKQDGKTYSGKVIVE